MEGKREGSKRRKNRKEETARQWMRSRSLYFLARLRRDLSAKMKREVMRFRRSSGAMVAGEGSAIVMAVRRSTGEGPARGRDCFYIYSDGAEDERGTIEIEQRLPLFFRNAFFKSFII